MELIESFQSPRVWEMKFEILSLLLVMTFTADTKLHHSPFLDQELNNTMIMVTSGEDLTLNCRIDRKQVRQRKTKRFCLVKVKLTVCPHFFILIFLFCLVSWSELRLIASTNNIFPEILPSLGKDKNFQRAICRKILQSFSLSLLNKSLTAK